MDELDSKLAAEHLNLYRSDGRSYDISEENGVLTLQLRRSVLWERFAVATLMVILVNGIWVAVDWNLRHRWPGDFSTLEWRFVSGMILAVTAGGGGGIVNALATALKTGEIWKFDKTAAKVHCNTLEIADVSKIRAVQAGRRGSRFYIALKLRYGRTAKLGRFAFCRSERAWRDDAAQIAAFLGVPLEIPPIVD